MGNVTHQRVRTNEATRQPRFPKWQLCATPVPPSVQGSAPPTHSGSFQVFLQWSSQSCPRWKKIQRTHTSWSCVAFTLWLHLFGGYIRVRQDVVINVWKVGHIYLKALCSNRQKQENGPSGRPSADLYRSRRQLQSPVSSAMLDCPTGPSNS